MRIHRNRRSLPKLIVPNHKPALALILSLTALLALSSMVARGSGIAGPEQGSPHGVADLASASSSEFAKVTSAMAAIPLGSPTIPPPGCGMAWSIIDTPNPGTSAQGIDGIAAISSNDAWAVGHYINDGQGIEYTLTMHWNGSNWSRVPSANPGVDSNFLWGVSASSSTDVWAVGYYWNGPGSAYQTLVLHSDGAGWTLAPSPNVGTGGNMLYGVTAVSTNDAWAVGWYKIPAGPWRTLILRWDGTQWSIVPSPNVGAGENQLREVHAVSANDAWAVGYYREGSFQKSLTLHWDGTQWSVVPNLSDSNAHSLHSVTALSSDNVWAVGGYVPMPKGEGIETLVLHWDGAQWSRVASPNVVPSTYSELLGVTAISENDMWAVGYSRYGVNSNRTLAMHWDGSAWSLVNTPNVGSYGNEFRGVGAASANDTWAAGYYRASVSQAPYNKTLAARYTDPCITPTFTPVSTSTRTPTLTATPTRTPPGEPFPTPTNTRTPCLMYFPDVQPTDYFYEPVRYLFCAGAVSGYADGTFRPYANTTRGQLCKIVVLAEGFPIDTSGGPHFTDVPADNVFYPYIESAYNRGIISGYADGTFRWGNEVTRAQLCKIVVEAEEWPIDTTGGPHFSDVPTTDPFYGYVETAYNRGIISGYGGQVFRPGNPATRGQICKIVYQAVTGP